ncbi:cellulose binding domain-containing protein, partial [Streptacidiphilus griseoplanus]|uniref:cellulose binding domain-containing protein n=1 Tax=Peterkaempfera griseoplana TaxID=66896 RepID=UPI001C379CAE
PPTPPAAACTVTYTRQSEWTGGFTADVTLHNTGTTALNGWTVGWSFPGDQKVTNSWNTRLTQTGKDVTAAAQSYNATVSPGG